MYEQINIGLGMMVIFGSMIIFMLLRFPIFFSLALACITFMLAFPGTVPTVILGQGIVSSLNSVPLVAIGFYFLLGEILNSTSIGDRLVGMIRSIIGWVPGSLSHINILASMVFAGVSGSATADTASVGAMMIPLMIKEGYPRGYAAAVTECSSVIGPVIPPSGPMIMFSLFMGCSVRRLFIGGLVPGIMLGFAMVIVSYIISKKRKYAYTPWKGWKYVWKHTKSGFLSVMLPVIVIIFLVFGIGTVVEIGAVACLLALALAFFYGDISSYRKVINMLIDSTKGAGSILCIIAICKVFTWILASVGVTNWLVTQFKILGTGPKMVSIIAIIIFFLLGMILQSSVIQLLIFPLLSPIVLSFGVDPIWFGVVSTIMIVFAVVTPPVGNLIYVTARLANCPATDVLKESLPFLATIMAVTILLFIFPSIVTFLPNFIMGKARDFSF